LEGQSPKDKVIQGQGKGGGETDKTEQHHKGIKSRKMSLPLIDLVLAGNKVVRVKEGF